MNKEFVPYEEALALKELEFDEPCIARFNKKQWQTNVLGNFYRHNSGEVGNFLASPLYQQAFRWFREKYNLYQDISTFVWDYDKKQLGFTVRTYLNPLNLDTEKKVHLEVYESYEEAELECLTKLIEIVQNK